MFCASGAVASESNFPILCHLIGIRYHFFQLGPTLRYLSVSRLRDCRESVGFSHKIFFVEPSFVLFVSKGLKSLKPSPRNLQIRQMMRGNTKVKRLYNENKFTLVLRYAYKNRTGAHENPEANLIRQSKETRDTRRFWMNGCHGHDSDCVSLPPEHKFEKVIPGVGISKLKKSILCGLGPRKVMAKTPVLSVSCQRNRCLDIKPRAEKSRS
ncbi:hypothetical protein PtA15_4A729 [Puccinia triticina]|uniref:Uncharacterized protein n=1 Tax=Puccinia triticina TaxID=208348 RepID=A0ABY7CGC2_9BASI|nr:uncharacterized protein PtA15_4A729 [Puccinia triticina]WAQ84276.1 hypothetical protein PtA15_4A729 [Puccinia triticina]